MYMTDENEELELIHQRSFGLLYYVDKFSAICNTYESYHLEFGNVKLEIKTFAPTNQPIRSVCNCTQLRLG